MLKAILRWIIVVGGISQPCAVSALAEESPSSGIVYSTKWATSLVYFCEKNRDSFLDCEFKQTLIRKKARPENLEAHLDEARKQFPKELTESCEAINYFKDIAEVLHGRKKVPKNENLRDYLKNMSDLEKRDTAKVMDAIIASCHSKSEKSFLEVSRISFDIETRTCIVGSHTYKLSFRLILDPVSRARSWVARGDPSGPCGVVQLSRFVPENLSDSQFTFWKYIGKKAVTNKQGLFMPGLACKDLDEEEDVFDWKSKQHALGCDYIEFSPM